MSEYEKCDATPWFYGWCSMNVNTVYFTVCRAHTHKQIASTLDTMQIYITLKFTIQMHWKVRDYHAFFFPRIFLAGSDWLSEDPVLLHHTLLHVWKRVVLGSLNVVFYGPNSCLYNNCRGGKNTLVQESQWCVHYSILWFLCTSHKTKTGHSGQYTIAWSRFRSSPCPKYD